MARGGSHGFRISPSSQNSSCKTFSHYKRGKKEAVTFPGIHGIDCLNPTIKCDSGESSWTMRWGLSASERWYSSTKPIASIQPGEHNKAEGLSPKQLTLMLPWCQGHKTWRLKAFGQRRTWKQKAWMQSYHTGCWVRSWPRERENQCDIGEIWARAEDWLMILFQSSLLSSDFFQGRGLWSCFVFDGRWMKGRRELYTFIDLFVMIIIIIIL